MCAESLSKVSNRLVLAQKVRHLYKQVNPENNSKLYQALHYNRFNRPIKRLSNKVELRIVWWSFLDGTSRSNNLTRRRKRMPWIITRCSSRKTKMFTPWVRLRHLKRVDRMSHLKIPLSKEEIPKNSNLLKNKLSDQKTWKTSPFKITIHLFLWINRRGP